MGYKVDGSKAQEFGALPEGEYEVFVTGAAKKTGSNGITEGVGLVLTVRNDTEQKGAGRKVRHTVWFTEKTEGIVQGFFKGMNFPDGTDFDGLDEIADAVKALPVRVKLKINKDNTDFNEVAFFKVTNIGGFYDGEMEGTASSASNAPTGDNKPIDISDDDLPF
jgi:hypothetical protein